jgi:hypothetical protein
VFRPAAPAPLFRRGHELLVDVIAIFINGLFIVHIGFRRCVRLVMVDRRVGVDAFSGVLSLVFGFRLADAFRFAATNSCTNLTRAPTRVPLDQGFLLSPGFLPLQRGGIRGVRML